LELSTIALKIEVHPKNQEAAFSRKVSPRSLERLKTKIIQKSHIFSKQSAQKCNIKLG
jgi:hypothetical protein